jgi:uncharacterized OB-fold protein
MRADVPVVDAHTRAFWDAARERRLLIKACTECGRPHYYPRPFCPFCWSDRVEWVEAGGRATLYTYSVVHVNDLPPWQDRVPYVAAVVELAEGPRMMTNLVGCDPDRVVVGMELRVDFRADGEFTVPVFRPAAGSSVPGAETSSFEGSP